MDSSPYPRNSTRRATKARSIKRNRKPRPKHVVASDELAGIRQRLAVAMACAYVTSAALIAQQSDSDGEAALILRRCVGDELDKQIERLDALAGRRPERKP
jgi:hypothetical protein